MELATIERDGDLTTYVQRCGCRLTSAPGDDRITRVDACGMEHHRGYASAFPDARVTGAYKSARGAVPLSQGCRGAGGSRPPLRRAVGGEPAAIAEDRVVVELFPIAQAAQRSLWAQEITKGLEQVRPVVVRHPRLAVELIDPVEQRAGRAAAGELDVVVRDVVDEAGGLAFESPATPHGGAELPEVTIRRLRDRGALALGAALGRALWGRP